MTEGGRGDVWRVLRDSALILHFSAAEILHFSALFAEKPNIAGADAQIRGRSERGGGEGARNAERRVTEGWRGNVCGVLHVCALILHFSATCSAFFHGSFTRCTTE